MEKIQFQSLSFCHGRQYLDASVIFPGVGHIWPNFLPAHNDVALVRNYQPISKPVCSCNSAQPLASVWSTALEFLVVADCLMGGRAELSMRTEFNFYDDIFSFDCIISWGTKTKKRTYQIKPSVSHITGTLWDGLRSTNLHQYSYSLRCQSMTRT